MNRRSFLSFGTFSAVSVLASPTDSSAITPSNYTNVKNYGARGNGNHDDTKAIQQAFDSLQPRDDVLLLPAGNYKISYPLELRRKKRVTIFGYGAAITQQPKKGDILRILGCEQTTLLGLTLRANGNNAGNGFSIDNSPYSKLRDVTVWNTEKHCLLAHKSWWLATQDCVFQKPGIGHYALYQDRDMNNVFHMHTRFGGYLHDSDDPSKAIRGGVLHNRGVAVAFIACDFTGCSEGLRIVSGSNIQLQNCYLEDNRNAIVCGSSTKRPRHIDITNCYFQQQSIPNAIAISVIKAKHINISNNDFQGNPKNTSTAIHIEDDPGNEQIVLDDRQYSFGITDFLDAPGIRKKRKNHIMKPILQPL